MKMNRGTLALGGALLALSGLVLFTALQRMTRDTNDTTYSNRSGSHTPPVRTNETLNSAPAKSQRRKDAAVSKRSRAWMLAREIEQRAPDLGAVVVTKADYGIESAGKGPAQERLQVGNWKILGYAGHSGLGVLTTINTREGIRGMFAGIYAETGDESFSTESPDCRLVVNLLVSENKQFSLESQEYADGSPNLPFAFQLTVKRLSIANQPK